MTAIAEAKFIVHVGIPTTFTTKMGKRYTALEEIVSIPSEHADVVEYLRELEVTTKAVTEIKAGVGTK